jgi:hypothetical protein
VVDWLHAAYIPVLYTVKRDDFFGIGEISSNEYVPFLIIFDSPCSNDRSVCHEFL